MTAPLDVGRGRAAGALLILLGAWGALVPFIGPYFGYAYTPDKAWAYTSGRLVLSVAPGAAAFLGGLMVVGSGRVAAAGGFLACLAGAWFVIGTPVMDLAGRGSSISPGSPLNGSGTTIGSAAMRFLEHLGFFYGLGVVIVFFGALAIGKSAVTWAAGDRDARADSFIGSEREYGRVY